MYESPEEHPTIRDEERILIRESQGSSGIKYEVSRCSASDNTVKPVVLYDLKDCLL